MASGKLNTTPKGGKGGKMHVTALKRGVTKIAEASKPTLAYTWRSIVAPVLIGVLIAVVGGWGMTSILTRQSFDLRIDLANQTICFEFGAALPYPVEIKADGRAYVNDIPLRAYLESLGWTVTWDPIAQEIIATKTD